MREGQIGNGRESAGEWCSVEVEEEEEPRAIRTTKRPALK
jgi:hypothetical protein